MSVEPEPDTPPASRASLLAKRIGVVFVGFLLAAVMVALGLWQLGVYNAQGRQQAEERASGPPVALESVARPGQEVGDAYGRQVRFAGTYDPRLQTLVAQGSGNRYRVLTGLRLPGGGILPVVRGMVTGRQVPKPPAGKVTGTGILMPSEGSDTQSDRPGGPPTAVVLPALAQKWNGSLINGFATLNPAESRAQSLQPVIVRLPSANGRLRNGFYALQWWVFAGFAIWMGFRMAQDLGRNPDGSMGSGADDDPIGGAAGDPDGRHAAEPAMSGRTEPGDSNSVDRSTTT